MAPQRARKKQGRASSGVRDPSECYGAAWRVEERNKSLAARAVLRLEASPGVAPRRPLHAPTASITSGPAPRRA
ncbi:Protein of unknown function [Gryllus bimaculatus]|nr:Protein of unknown function [Gryllus bimaculatus]